MFVWGSSDGTPRQRVLQNPQVNAVFTRLLAQGGDLSHFQTTVFSEDHRTCRGDTRRDFLDDNRLLLSIQTHGQTPRK